LDLFPFQSRPPNVARQLCDKLATAHPAVSS
jgi:hypothetical protein